MGLVRRWNLPRSSQFLRVFSGGLTTICAQTHLLAPATLSSRATHGSRSSHPPWAPALIPTKTGLFAERHQGCSLGQAAVSGKTKPVWLLHRGPARRPQLSDHDLHLAMPQWAPGASQRPQITAQAAGPVRAKGKAQPLPGGKMRPVGGEVTRGQGEGGSLRKKLLYYKMFCFLERRQTAEIIFKKSFGEGNTDCT